MAEATMIRFRIYNSMTKKKEVFKPIVPGKVSMYVCGVTAYDYSHIGHARVYVVFDLLYRYLKHIGYQVTYVRNFTDIDDKIINAASKGKEDPLVLSDRFIKEFHTDMHDLQILPPDVEPRVSNHMDHIIHMIQKIISNDSAYVVDGDVYFSVNDKKYPEYHTLFGRRGIKIEDKLTSSNPKKRNQDDFALWKGEKPGEMSWDSPWGKGRPGWHIECSAMSAAHLSDRFDIHGGGMDLIFPHHVNEIAQNHAASPHSNINYWIHNGFVTLNHEKMSKSTGKFYPIRQITKEYHPLSLRHFLLSTHYRSPVNYSVRQIEDSSEAVYYIYKTLKDSEDAISEYQDSLGEEHITSDAEKIINQLKDQFEQKLADDLQTTSILNIYLVKALRFMNQVLSKLENDQMPKKLSNIKSLVELDKEVTNVLSVLGLLSDSTYTEVLEQLKGKALTRAGVTEEYILQRIEERALARKDAIARKDNDFSLGDKIRSDLAFKGIALMDDDNDVSWRPTVPTPLKRR